MSTTLSNKVAFASILVFEVVIICLYGVLTKYSNNANPLLSEIGEVEAFGGTYSMFQDVQVMIFIGFGFLMTFLKKYARSALGFTFLLSCIVIQLDILLEGLWHMHSRKIHVSLTSIVNGDLAAAAILISFGAVLGKLSPLQLFYMAIFETGVYAANKYMIEELFKANDVGGSVVIHEFGAYFGLAISAVLGFRRGVEAGKNELEKSTYQSDITSMIGTLFLWMFWPSFNGVLAVKDGKYRAIINTFLSLTASCVITFVISILNKNWKFNMVHVENSTLAGGVAIGTSCNLLLEPIGALTIGGTAGALSVTGYRFLQDFFNKKLRIHDTCGVHYLHGIPGVFGGLIGAVLTFLAFEEIYGERLYDIFPQLSPNGLKRTCIDQGIMQFAAVGITLITAIAGGLVTGIFIVFVFPNLAFEERYNDELWWEEESAASE